MNAENFSIAEMEFLQYILDYCYKNDVDISKFCQVYLNEYHDVDRDKDLFSLTLKFYKE